MHEIIVLAPPVDNPRAHRTTPGYLFFLPWLPGKLITDTLFEDIFDWASGAFGLKRPRSDLKKFYLSNVVVEFDTGVENMIPAFQKVLAIIRPELKSYTHVKVDAKLLRLTFNCDPLEVPPSTVRTDFIIERRNSIPYANNRFFCSAPFPTNTLITKLEEIEQTLTS